MMSFRFLICGAVVAAAVSGSAQRKLVQDHGRLGKWIMSSRADVDDDDDGDRDKDLKEIPVLETPGEAPAFTPFQFPALPPKLSTVVYGNYRSYQVSPNGTGLQGIGAANEPSIAMDPFDPSHLAIGWRQFDSISSNFRQAGNAYSLNGGVTWEHKPVIDKGVFRSDPVLASTGRGSFYYLSLLETFYDSMYHSGNNGAQWNLLQESATGGDKQWFTVDNSSSAGHGNMYQSWSTAGNNWNYRQFSRSTNGGYTWEDPIYLPNYPIWGTQDVDNQGNLYIGGLADTYDVNFTCLKSTNAKYRNEIPAFRQAVNVNLGGTLSYGAFINPGGLSGQSFIAVDKSNGVTSGYVYMVASVAVNNANPLDFNFVRSIDGGKHWSKPLRLNEDAPNKGAFHWFGTIGVAPNGRIDAFWMDNRVNPSSAVSVLYYKSSSDGGNTWTHEVQVSPSFDPTIGYPDQNKIGDYMTVASDIKGANFAYCATFKREEDIWFLRIPAPKVFGVNPDILTVYQGTKTRANGTTKVVAGQGHEATLEAEYTLKQKVPGSMSLKVNGSTSIPTTDALWVYNWTTNQFDFRQLFTLAGKSGTNLELPTEPEYVSDKGQVRVMFRASAPKSPGADSPFTLNVSSMPIKYG